MFRTWGVLFSHGLNYRITQVICFIMNEFCCFLRNLILSKLLNLCVQRWFLHSFYYFYNSLWLYCKTFKLIRPLALLFYRKFGKQMNILISNAVKYSENLDCRKLLWYKFLIPLIQRIPEVNRSERNHW